MAFNAPEPMQTAKLRSLVSCATTIKRKRRQFKKQRAALPFSIAKFEIQKRQLLSSLLM